jgi:hypothetical protein
MRNRLADHGRRRGGEVAAVAPHPGRSRAAAALRPACGIISLSPTYGFERSARHDRLRHTLHRREKRPLPALWQQLRLRQKHRALRLLVQVAAGFARPRTRPARALSVPPVSRRGSRAGSRSRAEGRRACQLRHTVGLFGAYFRHAVVASVNSRLLIDVDQYRFRNLAEIWKRSRDYRRMAVRLHARRREGWRAARQQRRYRAKVHRRPCPGVAALGTHAQIG